MGGEERSGHFARRYNNLSNAFNDQSNASVDLYTSIKSLRWCKET